MIHPARRPFPDGSGIFETMRTENGFIAEFGRHMRRALSAAQTLSIAMPDEETIRQEVLKSLTIEPHPLGRLRICIGCLLYTSPSPRDGLLSRMPSSA